LAAGGMTIGLYPPTGGGYPEKPGPEDPSEALTDMLPAALLSALSVGGCASFDAFDSPSLPDSPFFFA